MFSHQTGDLLKNQTVPENDQLNKRLTLALTWTPPKLVYQEVRRRKRERERERERERQELIRTIHETELSCMYFVSHKNNLQ